MTQAIALDDVSLFRAHRPQQRPSRAGFARRETGRRAGSTCAISKRGVRPETPSRAQAGNEKKGNRGKPTVTTLLRELAAGEPDVADELLPQVYSELKAIAHRQLKGERQGHTLNTTALVHAAYLPLGLHRISWNDRVHLFAVAARAMRRVLIDYGVTRRAHKRGRDPERVTLDQRAVSPEHRVENQTDPAHAAANLAKRFLCCAGRRLLGFRRGLGALGTARRTRGRS